jgi:hypothetical protein
MKAYLVTSGVVFALVLLAHVARIVAEGVHVAANPWFVGSTVLSAALCVWAWRLLRQMTRR